MTNIFTNTESRNRLLIGTGSLSFLGAVSGFSIGILKGIKPIRRPVLGMAGSWGLMGLVYFATRESLLFEQRDKNKAYKIKDSMTKDSDELFSSTVAGMVTGGLLGAITRKRKGVAVGILAFGAFGYLGQTIFTKLYRVRQYKIMQELGLIPEYASTTNGGSGINGDSGTESANMAGRILEKLKKVPGWLPLRTINHEEYISILELRQKEVLDQILKIDVELEKLKFAEEGLLVKQQQSSE